MNTRTSGADLWTAASADTERELEENLFTAVRVEASQFWPVLASAENGRDFDNRYEAVQPQLDAAVASVLNEDTEGYFADLRVRLHEAFVQDFDLISERRTTAARRHQAALQAEVREEIRRTAGAADGTEDPDFLAAPAEGQTGPASTGGTPGSDAPNDFSEDGPTNDESAGPNLLENGVTGTFKTAVNFSAGHYQHIADGIKSAPVDDETRRKLADHFATHMAGTNPNFNRDRFLKASTGSRLDFRQAAFDYSGAGWTPANGSDADGWQSPGPDGVWVGHVHQDTYGDGNQWYVHFKNNGAIDTAVFPTEDAAIDFAKAHAVVPKPSTQTSGQNIYWTAAVDTSSIPPEWIQHAADRAAYSGSDPEWGLANRANANSWVTEWQILAPEMVKPGEYLVDAHGNVRQAKLAADDHNTGLHNPELDSRTECSQCGARGFDGQRCHSCGYTARTANSAEWDEIMRDPVVEAAWPQIRRITGDYISAQRGPDSEHGIGSSDINHTFVDIARMIKRQHSGVGSWVPDAVNYMVSEIEGSMPYGQKYHSSKTSAIRYVPECDKCGWRGKTWNEQEWAQHDHDSHQYREHGGAKPSLPTTGSKIASGEQCTVCGRPATQYVGAEPGYSASGHHVCDAHAGQFDKKATIDGETWDTGEVALWFSNFFPLYHPGMSAPTPQALEQLWSSTPGVTDSVNLSKVNWQAVYDDIHADD